MESWHIWTALAAVIVITGLCARWLLRGEAGISRLRRLKCSFGRHELLVTQQLRQDSRRMSCPHCGGMWIECRQDGEIVLCRWSATWHQLYERHGYTVIYQPWEGRKP